MGSSVILFIIVVNVLTLFLMRVDKKKAMKKEFRIPERTFFLLSFLGGALGTYIGMKLFRHKTKHKRFTIGIPILILWNLGGYLYLFTQLS